MAMRNDVDGFGGEAGAEADVTGVPALPGAEGPADNVVQVAQAEGAAPATIVVAIDAGAVRLPEGTSIDNPRVNGTDLEFVQPDGTVIVIPNGAVTGFTLFIGGIEIPPQAVAAIFEANGIETAAGPGAGQGESSSGGNFGQPVPDIGPGLPFGGLLPPTDLAFGRFTLEQFGAANSAPRFALDRYIARLSEEGLSWANPDTAGAADTTNAPAIMGDLGASDPDGNPLFFSFGLPTTPMSSNGVPITWTGYDTAILTGWAGGVPVIIAVVTGGTGTYSITLLGPVDHAIAGVEDEFVLELPIVVDDHFGGTDEATIAVIIEDDSPLSGKADVGKVDEDGLDTTHSTGIGNDGPWGSPQDNPGNATSAQGDLDIDWGADNGDKGTDGADSSGGHLQDGALENLSGDATALTGRAVYFTNSLVSFTGAKNGILSSNSIELVITLENNGTKIVARAGEGGHVVFDATLSDDGTGEYFFRLYDQLDHAKVNYEDDIELTFNFTARDADKDTATGTFKVVVDDDMPVLKHHAVEYAVVNEDDIDTEFSQGTSPNDGNDDGIFGCRARIPGFRMMSPALRDRHWFQAPCRTLSKEGRMKTSPSALPAMRSPSCSSSA